MAVYRDKRPGRTGWVAEVQHQGRRIKRRAPTEALAHRAMGEIMAELKGEAHTKTGRPLGDPLGRSFAIDFAHAVETVGPSLWRGRPVLENAMRALRAASDRGLGSKRLDEVTTSDLRRVADDLMDRGRKPETARKHLSYIKRLLEACCPEHLPRVPRVPWPPKGVYNQRRALTRAEERDLLALLPGHVRDYCIVALDSGMRRGELMGLTAGQVHNGKVILTETKTDSPRTLALTPRAMDILRARAAGLPGGALLFQDITKDTLRYHWDRAKEAMGLADDEGFTPHCLRHTCATRLARRGASPWLLQSYLGHATIQTSMVYVKLTGRDMERAAELLAQEGGAD